MAFLFACGLARPGGLVLIPVIANAWDNVQMHPSPAGAGLSDLDLDGILSGIVNSI